MVSGLLREGLMTDDVHDRIVNFIARTRFPFPGQTTWPDGYVTQTNAPERKRAIQTPVGDHYPDIVITDHTGRVRELGEVEMTVERSSIAYWRAGSELADNDTPTGVKHFFVYVPAGKEEQAKLLLEEHAISYAGVRGFTFRGDGAVAIVPFVTKGDPYDHQETKAQPA
jgi:hypothetical protein